MSSVTAMEKNTLKRSSTECHGNGTEADGCSFRPKHAKQDGKKDVEETLSQQSTLEYQMSEACSQELKEESSSILRPALQEGRKEAGTETNLGAASDAASMPPKLKWKNTSLIKDADTVTSIIPSAEESVVFAALEKHRADPDRLNVVTAAILDSASAVVGSSSSSGQEDLHRTVECSKQEDANGAGTSNGHSAGGSDYTDVKNVLNRVKALRRTMQVDAVDVCNLLEKHKDRADRVEFVADILTQNGELSTLKSHVSASDDLFTEAIKLNAEFPSVDPSEIYDLLEKVGDQTNRLILVRKMLHSKTSSISTTNAPSLVKSDSISDNPLVCDDPVFRDMRVISKMFPGKDQNEIYALVEAHYYKPNRVQMVIEEFLLAERGSQDSFTTSSHSQSLDLSYNASQPQFGDLQADVEHLQDVFPDCDPNYIYDRLDANSSSADRVRILASEMFERRDYPRLKDMVEKQTKVAHRLRLHRLDITLEDFLAKFPEPSRIFYDERKEMKESYKTHVTTQLEHDFPDFKQSYIRSVMDRHNSHYLPAVHEIETTLADILARGGHSKKFRTNPRTEPLQYPEDPDEYFFYELWFSKNEQKVKDFFQEKEALRKTKVEAARASSELYECGCCFEDECLFEEMNVCADGHLFCRQCIARSAEAAFGEGKTTFPCLTGFCEQQIPLSVLKDVLPSAMFSKMLRKMQEEEVRQAEIPDLIDCPFCSFATIMDNPEDRVFRCLNPECLRDSCRLCREPNHVPLKCDEVEKQNETDMRTFIEKRVTEAMLRKCHRCGKRFVKDAGCNKMTCICGATSCYICREPDIDYSHFGDGRCGEGNMAKVHRQEMEVAAREAKEEYLRDHPEAADVKLKYDPLKHIPDHEVSDEDSGGDISVLIDYGDQNSDVGGNSASDVWSDTDGDSSSFSD